MNFQFKLRNGKKRASIIAELRFGSNVRIRLTTPFNIPLTSIKYWSEKKQLIKLPNDILDAEHINNRLNEIRSQVYTDFSTLAKDHIIDQQKATDKLNSIINPISIIEKPKEDNSKSNLVIKYYKWYIDFYCENISPNTGRPLTKGTVKGYRNALRHLCDYLESRNIKYFYFDDISRDFYYDFISFGQKLGYTRNYVGAMVQKLKTIVQSAYDEDIHSNGEFKKKYFKKFREEVNHPYLTTREIQLLYDLEIKSKYLDNIRDIFIIACYTGLRKSDLLKLLKNPKIEIFNGRKHIHIVQQKTNKPVFIPLKQIILDILDKRDGHFPPFIHENLINREVKTLLKRCGITELYTIEKTIGGKLVSRSIPKNELISLHSSRRSFCSNAYNAGMPLQDIMAFSGHGSEKMVLLYIKASAKEKSKRASEHVFFD